MPSENEEPPQSPEKNHRKSSKPIMEKRRRARINASLTELKALLLEVLKKEGTRHNKMEKADILEMTVKHLRQIQRQQFVCAANTNPSIVSKYQMGFTECAMEVTRYLSNMDGVDADLRTRVLNHLADTLQNVPNANQGQANNQDQSTAFNKHGSNIQPGNPTPIAPKVQCPAISTNVMEINNNCLTNLNIGTSQSLIQIQSAPIQPVIPATQQGSPQKVLSGFQLIPSHLPNGDLAVILPSNMFVNNQAPSYVIPLFAGTSATIATDTSANLNQHHQTYQQTSHTGAVANTISESCSKETEKPPGLVQSGSLSPNTSSQIFAEKSAKDISNEQGETVGEPTSFIFHRSTHKMNSPPNSPISHPLNSSLTNDRPVSPSNSIKPMKDTEPLMSSTDMITGTLRSRLREDGTNIISSGYEDPDSKVSGGDSDKLSRKVVLSSLGHFEATAVAKPSEQLSSQRMVPPCTGFSKQNYDTDLYDKRRMLNPPEIHQAGNVVSGAVQSENVWRPW